VENVDSGKKICCGFKIKISSILYFLWTFLTQGNGKEISPPTDVKHYTRAKFINCDFSAFLWHVLSWLRRFEFCAKIRIKNQSICLAPEFREKLNKSKRKKKSRFKSILPEEIFPGPQDVRCASLMFPKIYERKIIRQKSRKIYIFSFWILCGFFCPNRHFSPTPISFRILALIWQ
jgi:hypothetical protein